MDAQIKTILSEMLKLAGQDGVYAECGGDYKPGGGCGPCRYLNDCESQWSRVKASRRIAIMIEDARE
jgi:hypothetical protein